MKMNDEAILERAAEILTNRMGGSLRLTMNSISLHAALRLREERREVLLGYMLDSNWRLISVDELAIGGVNALHYSPAEVARRVVVTGARVCVGVHNHPGQSLPEPSEDDQQSAAAMRSGLAYLGVLYCDLVIGEQGGHDTFTGDRCTFVSTPITPAAALCPNCGTQTIGERS
jgi:DNA repair protein RadC